MSYIIADIISLENNTEIIDVAIFSGVNKLVIFPTLIFPESTS